MMLEQLHMYNRKKVNLNRSSAYTEVNSQKIMGFNVEHKIIKFLGKKQKIFRIQG